MSPVAMVMLKEDPRLQKLRFELVPKKLVNLIFTLYKCTCTCAYIYFRVTEKCFWRNYFYRVSLIKQSVQLSTLSAGKWVWSTTPLHYTYSHIVEFPKPVVTDSQREDHPDSSSQTDSKKEEERALPIGDSETVSYHGNA